MPLDLRICALTIMLALAMPAVAMAMDPTTVTRTGKPNDCLVCPAGACGAAVDLEAPAFAVEPLRLLEAWREVIASSPRTTIVQESPDALTLEATQASRFLGFVDEIAIKILPLADGRSSFAAYSHSRVGYWDMGVNRARLEAWIAAVATRIR